MRSFAVIVLCWVSPSAGLPWTSPNSSESSGSARHSRVPIAVAHRGASGDAPENTMAALRLAHELGAEGYETDLHMTRDGEIVLLHDADIRRTTRGWPDDLPSYNIRDLDWAFVSTLDAGSWFAPEFAGERVPLLREGLDFARAVGILAYLDVKSTATGPEGLGAIASILEEYQDISQRIIVGVWSELALANANAVRLQQLSQLSFIGSLPPAQAAFEGFIALNLTSFNINHVLLTQPWVTAAQVSQLEVFAWTVNEMSAIERMVGIGVDAIVTDFPARVPSKAK